jgi:hypothetical protein
MRTTSGATHQTDRQRPTSMRTPMRTQTPILHYGVHRSITRPNPRIGYLASVSQLKLLDLSTRISTRAQIIYLHIVVPLRHPLVIPRLPALYLSFFSFSSGFILGWFWGGYTLYAHLYVLLTHSLLEPDDGESHARWGKEVNKTGMIASVVSNLCL